jgi:hypothetical protein
MPINVFKANNVKKMRVITNAGNVKYDMLRDMFSLSVVEGI